MNMNMKMKMNMNMKLYENVNLSVNMNLNLNMKIIVNKLYEYLVTSIPINIYCQETSWCVHFYHETIGFSLVNNSKTSGSSNLYREFQIFLQLNKG